MVLKRGEDGWVFKGLGEWVEVEVEKKTGYFKGVVVIKRVVTRNSGMPEFGG
jgi:hypothetical protein